MPYLNNADDAGSWLTADYTANGASYNGGGYVDLILALAAISGDRDTADAALDDLEAVAASYSLPGGVVNPGATAKVMLAVQALRGDVKSFAGLDLNASLRSTVVTTGVDTGRFGTSGVFTQSLAMMALNRSGGVPATAVSWLAAKQCPDGSFSWGSCSFSDADHTALAGSALSAAGGQTAAVNAAAQWLVDNQNPDGGFGDGASNANSTGLAAQLLRATGHHAEADAAANWIQTIQYDTSAGAKAGAIPWQAGTDGGLFLATTQGVLAFGAGPFHQLAFPEIRGEACPDTNGVTVIVDLARFDNTIRVACAAGAQATGWAALESAGYTVGSVPGYEGQAICTIEGQPAGGYPECWNNGFWSYWHDETRTGDWAYSNFGAAGRTPPPGSVEGWRYEPSWATHDARPPGVDPLWGATCTTPDLQSISTIDDDETLTLTGGWGAPVEVTTLDGTTPLTLAAVESASWTPSASLALAGESGPVRVLARSADPACTSPGVFHAVMDVQVTYPPNASTPGTNAIDRTDPIFVGWATGHSEYTPGPNVSATWQVPSNAYGQPGTSSGDVVALGDNGTITLTFDHAVVDGSGADFAVFENGFTVNGGAGLDFLELGYVEVSSDGEHFVRFDSASRRATPVGSFVGQSATELGGLAGRDLLGKGTPFDLSALANDQLVRNGTVDLGAITHVRIVDIPGDGTALDSFGRPIYDPYPTTGSGGFDLAGVGVIHQAG